MAGFFAPGRVLGVLAAAAIAAVWIGVGARGQQSAAGPPSPSPPIPPDPLVVEIREHTGRLRRHLTAASDLGAPRRDPFRFAESRSGRADAAPLDPPVPVLPPPPALPELTLAGIAEDPGPDGPVRTAVISTKAQVFLAREGDQVGSRYQIVRIGTEVVEVRDLLSGAVFTLALK